jgi:hypothetical protein
MDNVQDHFRSFIRPHLQGFLDQLGYNMQFDMNRFVVIADVEQYNFKEDPFVWKQSRGDMALIYNVYIDGIFICNIDQFRTIQGQLKEFWKGFLEAYNRDDNDAQKLWLDKALYDQKAKEKKQAEQKKKDDMERAIKNSKPKSEADEIGKEIAIDVIKNGTSTTTA